MNSDPSLFGSLSYVDAPYVLFLSPLMAITGYSKTLHGW